MDRAAPWRTVLPQSQRQPGNKDDVRRPADIAEETWRRLTPASRRALAVERVCGKCGADKRGAPAEPGECWLHHTFYCAECGPAAWEEAQKKEEAQKMEMEMAVTLAPGRSAPLPAEDAAEDVARHTPRQLQFDF